LVTQAPPGLPARLHRRPLQPLAGYENLLAYVPPPFKVPLRTEVGRFTAVIKADNRFIFKPLAKQEPSTVPRALKCVPNFHILPRTSAMFTPL
jgi:hypothetical protein